MPDVIRTQLGRLSAVGAGNPVRSNSSGTHTVTVTVSGSGSVSYAGELLGSNDLQSWTTVASLSGSGTGLANASASIAADYAYWRLDASTLTAGATATGTLATDVVVGGVSGVSSGAAGAISPYAALAQVPDILAFWDFSEPRAPYYSKLGKPHALRQGPGSRVRKGTGGPLGHSIVLNGTTDYLYIPANECGELNIGANGGNQCCVLAWVKRNTLANADFVAGIWQEDDGDPRRQYGLFIDLDLYGGNNKVCMHISKMGGASPGLPYSRDYSSNGAQDVELATWNFVAGTYDGASIRSYLEGRFESYSNYTEPGPPFGQSRTYDKNPYSFPDGMNSALADFTVGAVRLTSGMGNFLGGEIAALCVMKRAPSLAELVQIQIALSGPGWGFRNGFLRDQAAEGVNAFGDGYNAYRGATAIDDSASSAATAAFFRTFSADGQQKYILRQNAAVGIGMFTWTSVPPGITTSNLDTLSLQAAFTNIADAFRICVRIGSNWYATNATYSNAQTSPDGNNWSTAETKTLTFSPTAANWRDVTLTPGTTLTLAGAARSTNLPSGDITGFGVLCDNTLTGNLRFRNFEVVLL